jgi:hypothetical protein
LIGTSGARTNPLSGSAARARNGAAGRSLVMLL